MAPEAWYPCQRRSLPALRLVLFGAWIGVSSSAMAETDENLASESSVFFDMPTVLSPSRLSQPRSEAPAAVTIIDRGMIRAAGVREIADVFRLVPGFIVGYNHGHHPVVAYRGLSDSYSRRMQVLVDGRSVYTAIIGGVVWSQLALHLDDIERIEVIRGSNTAAYGSNSFLGVVNIVTVHAAQAQGTDLGFAVGEHRVREGFARQGWSSGANAMRLSLSYQQDDGFDELPDTQRISVLNVRSDYAPNTRDTIETQFGVNLNRYDAGHPGRRPGHQDNIMDPPHEADTLGHFQQIRWRRAFGSSEEVSVQVFHNYANKNEDYLTGIVDLSRIGLGRVQIPTSLDVKDERYDLEFQHTLAPFERWRFVWGLGARLDKVWSQTYFATDTNLSNRVYRLFASGEWRASPHSVFNAGAMLEQNGIGGTEFSPRVAYNYHISPAHTLRAAVSRAIRSPTIYEEHSDFRLSYQGVRLGQLSLSRGGLAGERMVSYEVGYLGALIERTLAVDFRLFRDRLADLITEVEVRDNAVNRFTFGYRNDGRADFAGIELQLDFRPGADTRLMFGYSRTWVTVSDVSSDASFNAKQQEDSVPPYTASLLISRRLHGPWWASAAYYRVPDMYWLGEGDAVTGYGRLDLRLARELKFGDQVRGEVAAVVQNQGSSPYTDFDQEARFDRRAFVTLRLTY